MKSMVARWLLTLLVFASFMVVAAPPSAAGPEACASCPAAGGSGDECGDDCPLCFCGPHRGPMAGPPAAPSPQASTVAPCVPPPDHAALTPTPSDILHVPRALALLPQS